MRKLVVIMRGLPGSGKSTMARWLASGADTGSANIYSTDDFFLVEEEGEEEMVYRFDPTKLGDYHGLNFRSFCEGLGKYNLLIVDNTNTRRWEWEKYENAAKKAGYSVQFLTVGEPKSSEHVQQCFERCIHNVPLEKIQQMSDRWEDI